MTFWQRLLQLLLKLLQQLLGPKSLKIVVKSVTPIPKETVAMANNTLQLPDVDQAVLSIQEEDAAGNPTTVPLDAAPTWSVTDTSVLTLTAAVDGMTATVASTGKLGTCTVNVAATVAGKAVTGGLDVTVVPSAAAQIAIVPGAPTPKP